MGYDESSFNMMPLAEALQLLYQKEASVLAGGTDFFPASGDYPLPEKILDITQVEELRYIRSDDSGWTIGAGTTWTDLIQANLPRVFDSLKEAAREVGSIQIQNAGTIAGNLCNASPAADGVPPLLTLNAEVELASVKGQRRLLLSEFIHGPRNTDIEANELMTAIHIPSLPDTARSGFFKLGSRKYLVISVVMASIVLLADEQDKLVHVSIAVGACSAVAKRLTALEQRLLGKSIHSDLLSLLTLDLFDSLTPIDDVRSSGQYRTLSAFEIVRRLLGATLETLPAYTKSISPGTYDGEVS